MTMQDKFEQLDNLRKMAYEYITMKADAKELDDTLDSLWEMAEELGQDGEAIAEMAQTAKDEQIKKNNVKLAIIEDIENSGDFTEKEQKQIIKKLNTKKHSGLECVLFYDYSQIDDFYQEI